jgi:hypothetical protein
MVGVLRKGKRIQRLETNLSDKRLLEIYLIEKN